MTVYMTFGQQQTYYQPQIAEKDVKFSFDPKTSPLFYYIQTVFMQLFCFCFAFFKITLSFDSAFFAVVFGFILMDLGNFSV